MRNALFATASLAFVSSPAMAADMMSVGVGGYMQQWFGMSSVDDDNDMINDGVAQQSDSEVHFRGKLETDSGLSFSVKVELEGNGGGDIDESQATVGGSFGKLTLGAEDPASTLTHYGAMDVGISLNCGDTHKWGGGLAGCSHNGFGTYGHGHGDKNQIMYFSPRINGVQFGASYIPDTGQEGSNSALNDNDKAAWAVGANYKGEFGDDLSVGLSVGHYNASQVGDKEMIFDGMMAGATADAERGVSAYTAAAYKEDMDQVKAWQTLQANGGADAATAAANAGTAQAEIEKHQVSAMKADDRTFSNVGLQVGMGGFTFTVAYATMDGGAYKVERMDRVVTTGAAWDHDGDSGTADVEQTVANNPDDDIVVSKLVDDDSKSWDTWGTGVKYADGPMAVSLSHLTTEWDNGDEQAASMLSVSYTLAPGVASKSSIFMAEKDFDSGRSIEGTGVVTGIVIGF